MLTQNEKRWLRERTKFPVFSCSYCAEGRPMLEKHCTCIDVYPCAAENLVSTKDDVLEAAKFESRVAAKLAEFYHHTTRYLDDSDGQKLRCWETCPARFYCGDSYTHLSCGDAVLKAAQLAVEEEMNENS